MKKLALLAAVCCLAITTSFGQEFTKGDKVVSLGVGLGSTLYSGSFYSNRIPPVSAAFEMGIIDNMFGADGLSLGVGGVVGYTAAKWHYSGNEYGWKYSDIIVGARGAFHYSFAKKLDTYAGVVLGYDIVSSKEYGSWAGENYAASSSSIVYGAYIGARYYFTDSIGAFAEAGYDITYLKLGLAFRF